MNHELHNDERLRKRDAYVLYLGRAVGAMALALGTVLSTTTCTHEPPLTIDLQNETLYTWPEWLDARLPYVAAVDIFDPDTNAYDRGGSGTLIDGYVYTAGHVLGYDRNQLEPGTPCTTEFVATRDINNDYRRSSPAMDALVSAAGENSNVKDGDGSWQPDFGVRDEALLKADTSAGLRSSVITAHEAAIGEVVTFSNYQAAPGEELVLRHPKLKKGQNDRVVYKGVVIGRKYERVAVLTDIPQAALSSYEDSSLIRGGSGGPVWGANGMLVGLSNNRTQEYKDQKELQEQFNIKLSGASADQEFALSWMQPIVRKDFEHLKNALQPCSFNNQKLAAQSKGKPFTFKKY